MRSYTYGYMIGFSISNLLIIESQLNSITGNFEIKKIRITFPDIEDGTHIGEGTMIRSYEEAENIKNMIIENQDNIIVIHDNVLTPIAFPDEYKLENLKIFALKLVPVDNETTNKED